MECIVVISEGHSTTLYVDSGIQWSFEIGLIHVGVLGTIRHCIRHVKLGHYHNVMEVRVQEALMMFLCCSRHIMMLLVN